MLLKKILKMNENFSTVRQKLNKRVRLNKFIEETTLLRTFAHDHQIMNLGCFNIWFDNKSKNLKLLIFFKNFDKMK